jgi:AcrR family transcriptional regulator
MRRLGEALGMRAPSLYKHFRDKAAVEEALGEAALVEMGRQLEAAVAGSGEPVGALALAYRAFALAHPHLYKLATGRPLARERLAPGVEDAAAAPVLRAAGDRDRARALWGLAHGLVMLEIDGRFPADADLDAAWAAGVAAFSRPRAPG